MAIEIIPKQKIKKKLKVSLIDMAYYGVITLVFIVLIGYAISFIFGKNMDDQLEELGVLIQEKHNPETQALEKGILDFSEKLAVFKGVFDSYRKSSRFFGFLGPVCHEKVFFSKTNLNMNELRASLQGNTQSFKTLKEQILILDGQEPIGDIDLEKVSILEEGGISFDVSFVLKPEVFK